MNIAATNQLLSKLFTKWANLFKSNTSLKHLFQKLLFIPLFLMSFSAFAAPVNDDFANATNIAFPLSGFSTSGTEIGDNVGATIEPNEPNPNLENKTVWWKWVAIASGTLVVDTISSTFDTSLTVFSGNSIDTLTQVAFNNDIGLSPNTLQSRVTLEVTPGVYYFRVGSTKAIRFPQSQGGITLNWAITPSGQSISFPALANHLVTDAPFYVFATSNSNLPVSITSLTPNNCTVTSNLVTLKVMGTCTLAANQAGDNIFPPAPQVATSFTINSSIVAGNGHSLRIGADGKVYAWGLNQYGRLGDGTTINRSSQVPVNLPSGIVPIAVAAGAFHSLAIGNNGRLYTWGLNQNGQLGDGTTIDRSSPIVVNLPSGVSPVALAAGYIHSLAIGSDSKLYAWGNNSTGQLGDGTSINHSSPIVVNLPSGVSPVAIAAGVLHSLAIGSDGKLYAWGQNNFGQLGDGTTNFSLTPVAVNLPNGVSPIAVAAGGYHSLAIGSDSKLYAWGYNGSGQLGDGTTTDRSSPVIVNLPSGFSPAAITAGFYHSLAIGSDGKLYAWGLNAYGQLSDGTTVDKLSPVLSGQLALTQTINLPQIPNHLVTDAPFTLNATTSSGLPVSFSSLTPNYCTVASTTVTLKAVGTCTILANQEGDANTSAASSVQQSFDVNNPISASVDYTLRIASDGKLYGWGGNSFGQLGNGTNVTSVAPVQVNLPFGVTAVSVSAGMHHGMAIGSNGKLYTWGYNSFGQLGDGTTTDHNTPIEISLATGVSPVAIAAGDEFSYAIGDNGKLYAWGYNFYAQLGDASTTNRLSPVEVQFPIGVKPVKIAASVNGFALGDNGKVYTWGYNADGELGDGTTTLRTTPAKITLPGDVNAVAISTDYAHSIVLGSDSKVYTWGYNGYGQIGDGTSVNRLSPVQLNLPAGVVPLSVSAGGFHNMVVGSDGNLYTLGRNAEGQLGDATNVQRNAPVLAHLPIGVTPLAIEGGYLHSVMLGSDGNIYSWGSNTSGQLGDGTTIDRGSPVRSSGQVINFAPIPNHLLTDAPFAIIATASSGLAVSFTSLTPNYCTVVSNTVTLKSVGICTITANQVGDNTYAPAPQVTKSFSINNPIAAGYFHSLHIGNDSKLYAWGFNQFGQLGDGTLFNRNSPVVVNLPSGISPVSVAAGYLHTLAIGSDGKLYAWGYNHNGDLGDGTSTDHSSPVVVNLPSGVIPVSVAAGLHHSLAIGSDGKLYAWGYNIIGQIGDGTTLTRNSPVVVNLPSSVSPVAISAGNNHSLAIGSDGKLYAWGDNSSGQLGDGTTTEHSSPVVVNLPSGVIPVSVAAGGDHSLAIGSDGKLYAWGYNYYGQLGDGTRINRSSPVDVNLPNGVVPVAANTGTSHLLAIGSDGKLYAWGNNDQGQLGDGTTISRSLPIVINLPNGASPVSVTAGVFHSLVIGSDGRLYAWGGNQYGQLGDGSTLDSLVPKLVGLLGQTISFVAIADHFITDVAFTVSATASSGLPVSFASIDTSVCDVIGNTVTLKGAGTCTIAANQAGNSNTAVAPQVSNSFSVMFLQQTISFPAISNKALSNAPFPISASSSSGLTVTFISSTPNVCSVSGNTVTLLAAGTCTIEADQSGDANYDVATAVQQNFIVSTSQTGGGSSSNDADVPLPDWMLVLMAASLLGISLRKRTGI